MEHYCDLLNFNLVKHHYKPKLEIYMRWSLNNGIDIETVENTKIVEPDILFKNKKLILCLAYISLNYNFKGHKWTDSVFGHNITTNKDINNLEDILLDNNFAVNSNWDYVMCDSCEELRIVHYDENGYEYKITFDKIHEYWKNHLTYREICNEINNAPDKE